MDPNHSSKSISVMLVVSCLVVAAAKLTGCSDPGSPESQGGRNRKSVTFMVDKFTDGPVTCYTMQASGISCLIVPDTGVVPSNGAKQEVQP